MNDERNAQWRQARHILCVRLDSIGDVLMTTPAIRALEQSADGRRVTLLTSSAGAVAARHVPEIDDVITYEAPWLKATAPRDSSAPDLAMVRSLRQMAFDAAVIFTVYSQSALPSAMLCYFAEVPLRLAHCRENPYQLLTDWLPEPEPQQRLRHEVQRQLDLVAAIGSTTHDSRLSFCVPPSARERVRRLLDEAGVPPGAMIVVHPGATAPSRRYPVERFAEASNALARRGWRVVVNGTDADRDAPHALATALGEAAVDLTGRLNLGETAALLEAARLLIANNTGPVHVAAAVGTPVVDVYALTNPQHTPWGVPSRVLFHPTPCAYCYKSVCPQGHHDCLQRVPATDVVEAAIDLLEATSNGREGTTEGGEPVRLERRGE